MDFALDIREGTSRDYETWILGEAASWRHFSFLDSVFLTCGILAQWVNLLSDKKSIEREHLLRLFARFCSIVSEGHRHC